MLLGGACFSLPISFLCELERAPWGYAQAAALAIVWEAGRFLADKNNHPSDAIANDAMGTITRGSRTPPNHSPSITTANPNAPSRAPSQIRNARRLSRTPPKVVKLASMNKK